MESLLSNKNAPVSCLINVTSALNDSLKQQGNVTLYSEEQVPHCKCKMQCTCRTMVHTGLYLFITDPEEVDAALLQLCSSQLKLLQLYTDIQELHSGGDRDACPEDVRTRACTNVKL